MSEEDKANELADFMAAEFDRPMGDGTQAPPAQGATQETPPTARSNNSTQTTDAAPGTEAEPSKDAKPTLPAEDKTAAPEDEGFMGLLKSPMVLGLGAGIIGLFLGGGGILGLLLGGLLAAITAIFANDAFDVRSRLGFKPKDPAVFNDQTQAQSLDGVVLNRNVASPLSPEKVKALRHDGKLDVRDLDIDGDHVVTDAEFEKALKEFSQIVKEDGTIEATPEFTKEQRELMARTLAGARDDGVSLYEDNDKGWLLKLDDKKTELPVYFEKPKDVAPGTDVVPSTSPVDEKKRDAESKKDGAAQGGGPAA